MICSGLGGTSELPLGDAVRNGHFEIVKHLLDHGADPNAKTEGWPSLVHAAWLGRCEIVSLLLEAGANVNLRQLAGRNTRTLPHYLPLVISRMHL
jgi:ankyrin repeat protein